MVTATKHVTGTLRPLAAIASSEARWVDVSPQALRELALAIGDKVMVISNGDHVPGVVAHDGERIAVYCDAEVTRDHVLVRRRQGVTR